MCSKGNPCACVQKILEAGSTSKHTVKFENLSRSEKYFPMVARNEGESFYGIPPCPTEASAPGTKTCLKPAHDNCSYCLHLVEGGTTNNATREGLNENEIGASRGNGRADVQDSTTDTTNSDSNDDEQFWKTWNAEEFPKIFRMFGSYENYNVSCSLDSLQEANRTLHCSQCMALLLRR